MLKREKYLLWNEKCKVHIPRMVNVDLSQDGEMRNELNSAIT